MLPVLLLLLLVPVAARKGEKGKTPILGWNTWCTYASSPISHFVTTLSSGGGAVLPRRQDSCGVDWCTSKEILSVATEIKTSGLQAIGYDHINRECGPRSRSPAADASAPLTGRTCSVDDCWGERDNTTHQIIGDPARFPEGMPAFIKKLHAMVRAHSRLVLDALRRGKTSR